jgi:F420-0:gamma-glutamyl ligase
MIVRAIQTRVFKKKEDLVAFVASNIPRLPEGSVLAISSKVAALAEGRVASAKDKEKLIKVESTWRRRAFGKWWLTVRDGVMIVNAGIDDSNGDGSIILLPSDCFGTAKKLRAALMQHYRIRTLGVILTDSRVVPLRMGVTGIAVGYAGFKGTRDYRGKPDIFGRSLTVEQTNVADCLASAAILEMGEGNERQPLALITGAPVEFSARTDRREIEIPLAEDMYRSLMSGARLKRTKAKR